MKRGDVVVGEVYAVNLRSDGSPDAVRITTWVRRKGGRGHRQAWLFPGVLGKQATKVEPRQIKRLWAEHEESRGRAEEERTSSGTRTATASGRSESKPPPRDEAREDE